MKFEGMIIRQLGKQQEELNLVTNYRVSPYIIIS